MEKNEHRLDGCASVIVTTYRQPDTLLLVLTALARQTVQPAEVLVADDGSDERTLRALQSAAAGLPFGLVHVWQPDEGFRAARSRNNAISVARGETLAFLDQDTLPHAGWLEAHLSRAGARCVSLGNVLFLSQGRLPELSREAVAAGEFEHWHAAKDIRQLNRKQRKCSFYAWLRRFGVGIKNKPKLMSGNFAISRADMVMVNGFDEAYVGWGQEDDDLGRRLYAAGVRPKSVAARARVSHIPHPPRRAMQWNEGANIYRYKQRDVPVRCARGLEGHPYPDVRITVIGLARDVSHRRQ
jgi:glycosyltransferase involved in cell wall biosynthesis